MTDPYLIPFIPVSKSRSSIPMKANFAGWVSLLDFIKSKPAAQTLRVVCNPKINEPVAVFKITEILRALT